MTFAGHRRTSRPTRAPSPRSQILAEPGLRRGTSPTTWLTSAGGRPRGRLAPTARQPYGPIALDPAAPCCTTRRRSSRASRPTVTRTARSGRSVRTERGADAALRAAPRAARAADRVLHPVAVASSSRSTGAGCRPARRPEPVPASRSCSPRRRSSACARPEGRLLRDREPGRRLLQGRREAGDASGSPRSTPARAAAARARPRPAATTPACWSRSRRPARTAATRCVPRRRGQVRRGARRHERVLRLQGRPRRHARSPTPSSRASPDSAIMQLARKDRGARSRSARSRSTSGATAWPPATSSRSSPAARPRSSRRSVPWLGIQTGTAEDTHGWLTRLA
jgi:hypothetical protein